MKVLFFVVLNLYLSTNIFASTDKTYLQERGLSLVLDVSEFKHVSQNDEFEFDWSLSFSNINQDTHEINLTYNSYFDRQVDAFSEETITDQSTDSRFEYDRNNLFNNSLGYTSVLDFKQSIENDRFQDRYDISVAPLGLKWDILKTKSITDFSLSYRPGYGYLERFSYDEFFNSTKIIQRSLHHGVDFSFEFNYSEFTFSNRITYRHIIPFDKSIEATRDRTIMYLFNATYSFSNHLGFTFSHKIDFDDSRHRTQDISDTIYTNDLSFTYTF